MQLTGREECICENKSFDVANIAGQCQSCIEQHYRDGCGDNDRDDDDDDDDDDCDDGREGTCKPLQELTAWPLTGYKTSAT